MASGLHVGYFRGVDVSKLVRVRAMLRTGAARAIRESAGLSMAEVGEAVGVHRSTVLRWEAGERQPRGVPAIRYLELLEGLSR
jgi:DNA-binding transcriptional regulator YiaG